MKRITSWPGWNAIEWSQRDGHGDSEGTEQTQHKTLGKTGLDAFSMWRDNLAWMMEVSLTSPVAAVANSGIGRKSPATYGSRLRVELYCLHCCCHGRAV